jgi:MFS family permease
MDLIGPPHPSSESMARYFYLVANLLLPPIVLLAIINNEHIIACSNFFAVEAFSSNKVSSRKIMPQLRHDTVNKASAYNRVKTTNEQSNQSFRRHQSPGLSRLGSSPTDKEEGEQVADVTSSLQDIFILVFPLLLIYISNQWSRYSISYLVDFSPDNVAATFTAMNVDLQFTKSQYGLLASTAFTILFALSSLIAGSLADKYDRKTLTISSCLVWTLATLAQSQAQTYNEVLIARVVMGGACAFASPAAYTFVADKISRDKLAFANSIYGSGVYLGGSLASLSLLLDENVGWRWTLGVIGGFGAAVSVISGLLLPSDGERTIIIASQNGEETNAAQSGGETNLLSNMMQILSIPRVQYIFVASFLRFCAGLMIGVWAAPYFKQAFPDDATQYAVVNAFIVGGMGMTSGILGGYISDGLVTLIKNGEEEALPDSEEGVLSPSSVTSILRENFDEESIRLLLPVVGSLLAIPAWYQCTHAGTKFEVSMFWLAVEYLVAECWFGPTIAVLQSTVGTSRTGTAQGLFVLTGAVANSAPTLLGWIYGNKVIDETSSSSEVLGSILSLGVCLGYLLSSIFFLISARANKGGGLLRIPQNVEGE